MNKLLPKDEEAERFVLAGAFVDEDTMHALRPALDVDDFSTELHRRIWRAACDLYDRGLSVDTGLVWRELKDRGQMWSEGFYYFGRPPIAE